MKRSRKLNIPSFLFELVIVFIGVYGAFELNNYQQGQRELKIRENYFISFQSELSKLIFDMKEVKKLVDEELGQLDTYDASNGNQAFIPIYLSFQESLLITQAGFNDDVFVQLDPSLASSLTGGYDFVKMLQAGVDNYNQAASSNLYGLVWSDLMDRNGQLKPQFQWYRNNLNLIRINFENVISMMSNQALPAVQAIIDDLSD